MERKLFKFSLEFYMRTWRSRKLGISNKNKIFRRKLERKFIFSEIQSWLYWDKRMNYNQMRKKERERRKPIRAILIHLLFSLVFALLSMDLIPITHPFWIFKLYWLTYGVFILVRLNHHILLMIVGFEGSVILWSVGEEKGFKSDEFLDESWCVKKILRFSLAKKFNHSWWSQAQSECKKYNRIHF